ncbi:fused MFS/spermidine synthase [Changchengzhania lutea]|uniref:fused MFS/spermidine synthase n=1 Tax=Changchengzhania lutea TaxID=2049305 RepID=UPI001C8FA185|nr:fused MFS/spermidine synthase [Changchengzhania lutea]
MGLIFGNAAYATAATLAAFFLGLAIGGWFLGNASAQFKRPLFVYGLMEIGIALTALLLIPGIEFYETHYASVVALTDGKQSFLTILKFIFSITLLLLPTALMGGTFPVLAQFIGKEKRQLANRGTILYAVNTLGASIGALLAGFFLLSKYGVDTTYYFTIVLVASIGFSAILMDRLFITNKETSVIKKDNKASKTITKLDNINYLELKILAFSSGLLALSIETIWTKMFAQVLQNSIYSFSAILVVFLFSLGIGGVLSHKLVKVSRHPKYVLLILLSLGAISVGFSPYVFNTLTKGLGYLAPSASWFAYLIAVFKLSFLVVFLPTVIFGAIFPFLLKASPVINQSPGKFVGRLVLFNSIGSTIGPILAGFILLDAIGIWMTIKIIAILYGFLALYIYFTFNIKVVKKWLLLPIIGIIGVVSITNPPTVKLQKGDKILKMWQSSDGFVSIVESGKNIQMRLDNFYVLGDSRSILVEQMQGHIPLLIHPSPKKTLFLGMGTGITAGASLSHNVERVVVVELISNVIPAAKKYFSSWTNNLFNDKRVEIIADDARNFLLGSNEKFDVIVGDLFTPWHAGTGSLYTIEHFKQAKKSLKKGGIFAQWLPLYQLTPKSFEIISATFASVFPNVTLWRADFSGSRASIALIGQEDGAKLSHKVLKKNISNLVETKESASNKSIDHMAGLFYLGNLDALKNRLTGTVVNNDDKRTVEYKTPILSQQANAGSETYIVNQELYNLLSTLATNLPAEKDLYLSKLPPRELKYVKVGLKYFRYLQLISDGNEIEAESILEQIHLLSPGFLKRKKNPSSIND